MAKSKSKSKGAHIKPENFVRVRVWHASVQGAKTSVISGIISHGSVGHVTLETSKGYLSMWSQYQGSMGVTCAGLPSEFVSSPEEDEKYEDGNPPDYIFDFYTLDVAAVNAFMQNLMLVDLDRPYEHRQLLSRFNWADVNDPKLAPNIRKSVFDDFRKFMNPGMLSPYDITGAQTIKTLQDFFEKYDALEWKTPIDEVDKAKIDAIYRTYRSGRLMNSEQPIYGPLRPWKILQGGTLTIGSEVGYSCASSVYAALKAGGAKKLFKTPYNFIRNLLALSPNNIIPLLADYKRQELLKHPETAFFASPKELTAKEEAKFGSSDNEESLKANIKRELYEIRNSSRKLRARYRDKVKNITDSLDKFIRYTAESASNNKIGLDVIYRDVCFLNNAFKCLNKVDKEEKLSAALGTIVSDLHVIKKLHDRNTSLLNIAYLCIISFVNFLAEKIFDYADIIDNTKVLSISYSRKAKQALGEIDTSLRKLKV